ncbi:secreted protein [Massarina eburnea CBS 473.64]|uniref:Secreted protein n=1 Tax=Massarina eburnea CBS 473.64 TaxID=1395130 RepID=A0A6A6SHF1_9PLEO|nr:secreted protein [Massarina eburnea CBS 473.64]
MPSFLFKTVAASGLLAQSVYGYTQVNVASPFMYKNVDPIVFPGEYGKSHLHSFFGSDAVTASTNTSAELQKGCTNAENPNDLSIYWIPTALYTTDSGKTYDPIPVMRFSAYYNLGETEAEIAIPQNLKMKAGDASATTASTMPADAKASWFCESDDDSSVDANGFPTKTCSTHLQQLIFFPQCVNEDTLEVAYKSKSYGTTNYCPTGSKSMPQLRFSVRYDLRKVVPDGWSGTAPIKLASGNAYSSHGDFINGWTTEGATNMIATTKEKQKFSAVDGALGDNGEKMSCTQADADPSHGTSDYAESVAAMSKRSVAEWGWASRARMARQA